MSPGSSDGSAAARRSLAPRCSGFAREQDLDPAGSAGSYDGFALVEIPLPWPREITEHPALVPVAAMLNDAGVRVQGLVPGDASAPDDRRVVWFGISDRSLDVDEAARLYRGCAGLDSPEVQAVEREALRAIGWSWFDHRRRGEVVALGGDLTRVRLDAESPDGRRVAFEATVEVARLVPVPDCRKPVSEAKKSAPELRASGFAAA